jgi:hypothetical protein
VRQIQETVGALKVAGNEHAPPAASPTGAASPPSP